MLKSEKLKVTDYWSWKKDYLERLKDHDDELWLNHFRHIKFYMELVLSTLERSYPNTLPSIKLNKQFEEIIEKTINELNFKYGSGSEWKIKNVILQDSEIFKNFIHELEKQGLFANEIKKSATLLAQDYRGKNNFSFFTTPGDAKKEMDEERNNVQQFIEDMRENTTNSKPGCSIQ